MTNVLLIGNGAREHAIAGALVKGGATLFSVMKAKNPGIAALSKEICLANLDDTSAIGTFSEGKHIDFAVIGPEAPLGEGIVDFLQTKDIPSVGPFKELAQLETSKGFTRKLLHDYGIQGNPRYRTFIKPDGIEDFMQELQGNVVVKADGLCGGKGVKLMGEHLKDMHEAVSYALDCIEESGKVVVEEKLEGEEFSLQCFCDGETVLATPPVQDHKRAFVGDNGPNTGGMGSYSDANHLLPFLKKEHIDTAVAITHKVAHALKKKMGKPYRGIMYGGFMLTKNGVKLIEYNARFGDPETMNVLPIMKTNFVEVCRAIVSGNLKEISLAFENKASVCKYVVPEGYPDRPMKGVKIDVSGVGKDAKLYFAAVDHKTDGLYMTGSRAVALVGIADTLAAAEQIAERAAKAVKGPVFHREDIGTVALVQKRVEHMKKLVG